MRRFPCYSASGALRALNACGCCSTSRFTMHSKLARSYRAPCGCCIHERYARTVVAITARLCPQPEQCCLNLLHKTACAKPVSRPTMTSFTSYLYHVKPACPAANYTTLRFILPTHRLHHPHPRTLHRSLTHLHRPASLRHHPSAAHLPAQPRLLLPPPHPRLHRRPRPHLAAPHLLLPPRRLTAPPRHAAGHAGHAGTQATLATLHESCNSCVCQISAQY